MPDECVHRESNPRGGGPPRSVRLICAQSKPAHDEAPQQVRQEQYEDKDGLWHDEVSASDDRPETDVEG